MDYKILDRINSTQDLKKLNIDELKQLSAEIREFLIENISKTGGHLASNLGVVELTIAMHYVFDSPNDKFLWDVGHQSYIHKILTGRKDEFPTLRQYGGLAGFPKRNESEHDIFNAGHSGTAISAALGIAKARDINGEDFSIISVVGDGALGGGMCYEAINHAGILEEKIIVILNDNNMAISSNASAISGHLTKLRTNPQYKRFKTVVQKTFMRIPKVGKVLSTSAERLKNRVKYFMLPNVLFEEMGFVYLGPINGHDLPTLIKILNRAKNLDLPVLIHAVTKKGKGYKHSEQDPERFHGVSPFTRETGKGNKKASAMSASEVFGTHLTKLAREDKSICAITAAMPKGTGLDIFREEHPDRFMDAGMAEEHAVTFAAGMATQNIKPVVCIYSTFFQRAYDQILHDVCMQNLPVIFGVDRAGLVGEDGETHHGVFDISYLRHMPNMHIMSPSCDTELKDMLELALNLNAPVAIRYPRGSFVDRENVEPLRFGKWSIEKKIKDITIVATGRMFNVALESIRLLAIKGYDVGLVNARFIKPLDDEMLFKLSRCSCLFVVEENAIEGGLGSAILEFYSQNSVVGVPCIELIGVPDRFIGHGSTSLLLDEIGLTVPKIATRIEEKAKALNTLLWRNVNEK